MQQYMQQYMQQHPQLRHTQQQQYTQQQQSHTHMRVRAPMYWSERRLSRLGMGRSAPVAGSL